MKKARSIALNYAFVGFLISFVIALILWFLGKSITAQEYRIPYGFGNETFLFFKLPKIDMQFLPLVVALITFQITYLKQIFIVGWDEFLSGIIIATLSGIILGIIGGLSFAYDLSVMFWGAIGVVLFGALLGIIEKSIRSTVTGVVFGVVFGIVYIFIAILFHSPLGIAENVVFNTVMFTVLVIISLVLNAVLPILVGIVERLVLIIKAPEVVGVSRPAAVDATEEAS